MRRGTSGPSPQGEHSFQQSGDRRRRPHLPAPRGSLWVASLAALAGGARALVTRPPGSLGAVARPVLTSGRSVVPLGGSRRFAAVSAVSGGVFQSPQETTGAAVANTEPTLVTKKKTGLLERGGRMAKKGKELLGKLSSYPVPMIPKQARAQPLNVALLVEPTPFTHVCGYANRFKEMLKYLKEFGDSVSIATPDDKPEAPSEFLGFPVRTLNGARLPMYPEVCLTIDHKRQAWKMLDDAKPDLIHVSSPGFLAMAAAGYAKMLDIPLVMSYHTHLPVYAERYAGWIPFSRRSSWLYIKALHSFADLTLVTSPQILDEFRAQGIKRAAVWRKGVDTDVFHPRHRDQQTRDEVLTTSSASSSSSSSTGTTTKDTKKTILLYVGRLSVEKRLDELATVLDACPETTLALVGGGPHEQALRRHFERFGDRVTFCGVLRGEALSKAYASADIFCMPSDSETLGFVVIEAMASGLAVVGADAGGIPSIISHSKNGLLAPPRDPAAFADAVKSLVNDASFRETLQLKARKDSEGWGWRAATRYLRDVQYLAAVRRHKAQKKPRTFRDRLLGFLLPDGLRRKLRLVTRDLWHTYRKIAFHVHPDQLANRVAIAFAASPPSRN